MLLLEPQQTPYDLRFRLGTIPVRVHPMFWLFSAILGWRAIDEGGLQLVLVWIACAFVSILLHELGHALMGMAFGTRSYIVLYSFGGLAVGSNNLRAWWKRVAVSFAGPLAGFLFLGVILLGLWVTSPVVLDYYLWLSGSSIGIEFPWQSRPNFHPLVIYAIFFLIQINLFWGLLNLLPIWPLDGGQISRDLLSFLFPAHGYRVSLGISFVLAGLLALNAIVVQLSQRTRGILFLGGWWMALLFGMLAFQSFQLLQQASHRNPYDDPWLGQRRPWDREDSWRR